MDSTKKKKKKGEKENSNELTNLLIEKHIVVQTVVSHLRLKGTQLNSPSNPILLTLPIFILPFHLFPQALAEHSCRLSDMEKLEN